MRTFLPGTLTIEPGGRDDYRALERFHYRAGRPATFCLIRRAIYRADGTDEPTLAGVATLSWPTLRCFARETYFGIAGLDDRRRAEWLDKHLRTLSRVIVHPRFRGMGLASGMIRRLCDDCPTPYVEAMAAMGAVHPMFDKAEMIRLTPTYFVSGNSRPIGTAASSMTAR